MEPTEGFEPPTHSFVGSSSVLLSYVGILVKDQDHSNGPIFKYLYSLVTLQAMSNHSYVAWYLNISTSEIGAIGGNRTRVLSLEDYGSTIELRPHGGDRRN